jgi:beta-glucosidase
VLPDHPARFNYPGESGRVRYGENVFMGYRGYEFRGLAPRFPFGHGLSYTTFDHGDLAVSLVGEPVDPTAAHRAGDAQRPPAVAEVRIEVTNTGSRPGVEVVQLFVAPPPGDLARPPRELKGFAKVRLAPGERRTVELTLDARAFTAYDPVLRAWRSVPGAHRVVVASSGRPVREATVELPGPLVLPVR